MRALSTLRVFGIYLLLLGFGAMLIPNVLLRVFRLPPTHEVWVRVVGMLVSNYGLLYLWIVRTRATRIVPCTVVMRLLASVYLTAFAVFGLVKPIILLFAAIDAAGGLWTGWASRSDERTPLSGAGAELARS